MTYQRGFSLVELSIVLVILGLLTGGILAGQSLIRAAELRSVTRDFARYQAAIYGFRDKYMGLPGDLSNAESFWGTLAPGNRTTCNNTPATGLPTCNGNGDGYIDHAYYEKFRAWQHLANAGMIEGKYTGTFDSVSASSYTVSYENSPMAKLPSGVYAVMQSNFTTGTFSDIFIPPTSMNFMSVSPNGATVSGSGSGSLKPEEAWNLDQKMDDGTPGLGRVTSGHNYRFPNCATTDASDAVYKLNNNTAGACPLFYGV